MLCKARWGACMSGAHTRKVQTRHSCRPHWSSGAEWQPTSLHRRGSWLANGIRRPFGAWKILLQSWQVNTRSSRNGQDGQPLLQGLGLGQGQDGKMA